MAASLQQKKERESVSLQKLSKVFAQCFKFESENFEIGPLRSVDLQSKFISNVHIYRFLQISSLVKLSKFKKKSFKNLVGIKQKGIDFISEYSDFDD